MGRWLCALFTVDWQLNVERNNHTLALLLPAYSPKPTPAVNNDEVILKSLH